MQSAATLPIKEIYKIHNRLPIVEETGIKEYPIIKKYFGLQDQLTGKSLQKIKTKRNLKLRTYLDEEQKKHRNIPGPGKYNIGMKWDVPEHKIINPHDRITFLDQVIKDVKINKSPGPGQHQKVQIYKSKSFSKQNSRRYNSSQRIFYYDQIQYCASKMPGPGSYNVSLPPKTGFRTNRQTPQQNIKNFRIKSQKKFKNSPKLPDIGTYNPQQSNFFTFKTASKVKASKKSFGIGQRFKTQPIGSGLSPDKYQVINEWSGKQSSKKSYEKQGLDIQSKPQPRIYN